MALASIITEKLWIDYRKKTQKLLRHDDALIEVADSLMGVLVNQIHDKIDAIHQRIIGNAKSEYILKAENKYMSIMYIVYEGGRSKMVLRYSVGDEVTYDSSLVKRTVRPKAGYVYFLQSKYGFKIGRTNNLHRRLNEFGVKLPFDHWPHSFIQTRRFQHLEADLHLLLANERLNGEWFDLTTESWDKIDKYLYKNNFHRKIYENRNI